MTYDFRLGLPEEEAINKFTKDQLEIFWLPDEINVEKDVQDVLVNFTESEKHAVVSVLKLFSVMEIAAGDEYWGNRYKKMFKGPEFHRMASGFSMVENCIHQPFYNKINQLLHLDSPEFYESYKKDETLSARMAFVEESINDSNDLKSLGVFSMVEGVVLYSQFAFLKHFQSQGKNKLMNIVRGINFSVRDENIHSTAGAWSFRHKMTQTKMTDDEKEELKASIFKSALCIYEHEKAITKMIFEKGRIDGITEIQLVHFVESRINECLKALGYEKMFKVSHNPIADWFYKGINDYSYNDNFSGISNQYHRNWDSTKFTWKAAA